VLHQRADGAVMMKSTRPLAVRYGTALAIVGLALLVKLLLEYLIDVRTPFLLFYVAVMVSTLLGGLGPGLTAVAMSTVVTDFFFVAPNSLLIQSSEQNVKLVIFLLEGAAISILCVRLISARKRVESALEDARQSEGLRRSVIEQAIENIFLVDVETSRVLETNAALQHSLGYAPEELKNMTLYEIVAHDKASVDRNIERVLENGRYVIGERSFRRKDGTLSEVEVSASAMSYSGRDVMCIVAHEVTDRKRAEEALREARVAERRRMARDLHDGAMQDLAYAMAETQIVQTLSQDPELNARIERKIEALRRVERELRSAVYNLRQEEARGVSLVRSVEALAELNHQLGPGRKIVIDVGEGFPDELPEAVSKEFLRVVQEALTNARRHSGAKTVRVSLRAEEDDLVAEVADDGRGYGPEVAPGLGLVSMRERATVLGGELEVRSKAGEGTIVQLRIPVSGLPRVSSGTNGGRGS
jgi:PAS domain S-box-containing protein